jgi:hypothetical protein
VRFDALPTARKYRRCRSSIIAFHYAEKTRHNNEYGIAKMRTQKTFPFYEGDERGFNIRRLAGP